MLERETSVLIRGAAFVVLAAAVVTWDAVAPHLGAVALWRGSLRPVMMAHAWTDVAAGLLRL